MKLQTIRSTLLPCFLICLLISGMFTFLVPARESRAQEEENAVETETDNGVIYTYVDLKEYKNSVEIIGIDIIKESSTLKIPEKLKGKKVVSISLRDERRDISPVTPHQYDAAVPIKKIILPKTIRPLNSADTKSKSLRLTDITRLDYFSRLESIETVPGSKYVKAEDGILYSADRKDMIAYPQKKKSKTYRMPSSVVWSAGIFSNPHIKRIIFSKNKKFREVYVEDCDRLESVYMPDNITKISNFGFSGDISLKTIRWSKNLKSIGYAAFENCNSLTKVKLPGRVREIEERAFHWCASLKKVTLPESVAYVGDRAFSKGRGKKNPEIKKAPYLLSVENKKAKEAYTRDPYHYTESSLRYIAVVTVTNWEKIRYYNTMSVRHVRAKTKNMSLRPRKKKGIFIMPDTGGGGMKHWKVKPDILKFTSSNPKVAKVTARGVVEAKKRGKAVITVRMKTSSAKCKVKVTVR